jgi:hypothetical protein
VNQISKYINWLFFGAACLFFFACKTKPVTTISHTDSEGYDKGNLNKNYDWTGTYQLKDSIVSYILKLHKRSVDGSYEMQFYSDDKNSDLYKSSIYDAKDDTFKIYIKYLNNFHMDASPLGFKSGDTLFILQHINSKANLTIFKSFKPKRHEMFEKINEGY